MNELSDFYRTFAPIEPSKPLMPEISDRAAVAFLCRSLHREGYDDHLAGHITIAAGNGEFYVNPWEIRWDEITAADVVKMDSDGKHIDGPWNVTPATRVHIEIHKLRPDTKVIIHNHSKWGTIWANAKRIPPIYDQTSAQTDGDPILVDEYAQTFDHADAAKAGAEAIGNAKTALLAHHGVLITGNSIQQAYLRAVTLEWRCRNAYHSEQLGASQPLPPEAAQSVGKRLDDSPCGFPFLWESAVRREIRDDPAILNSDSV